ncbi:LAETG motif-containing sortase-dependent surface protein [Streptomyces sp. NPDC018964]|uniref:LAETG motif-containing sortase-dependent surface protein n=1 Tax=Streptomyces sp. NPDC018964 TaxID=3365058 RepID=UPI003791112A
MKLRRAVAAAAATAVIAPLALFSAPAAFATGGEEAPGTSTSTSAGEESLPADGENPPTEDENPPADDENPPTEDENPPADDENPPTEDENPPADDEDDVELCLDEEGKSTTELSADLHSGLSGLPETIVAGSGWTTFSFDVSNRGDDEIKDIRPLIGVTALGWDEKDHSGQVTVQVLDKATGTWNTLADAAGEGGTFAAFSLGAGRSVSYQLRLSVSGKAPDALGLVGGFAEYADDEGCWIADDSNGWIYFFDILAAGSDPGEPNDAEPQTGGKVEIDEALDEVKDVEVTGSLAETGSSSALPMIGLAGGVAVVAGAGAVFVVRRRQAGPVA